MDASPTIGFCDLDADYARVYPEPRTYCEAYFGILTLLARGIHARRIVEIGVDQGVSSRAFLSAGAEVWAIDPREECDHKLGPKWHFINAFSQHVQGDWIAGDLDLLYVDGDHSYMQVCGDLSRFGPLVRDGGLVVLDDYHVNFPGKVRWINDRWDVLEPQRLGPLVWFEMTAEKRGVL